VIIEHGLVGRSGAELYDLETRLFDGNNPFRVACADLNFRFLLCIELRLFLSGETFAVGLVRFRRFLRIDFVECAS